MIEYLKDSQTALYDFGWESLVQANIWQGLRNGIRNIFAGTYEAKKGVRGVFKQSKANAKLAGALLGCTLALREPFHT